MDSACRPPARKANPRHFRRRWRRRERSGLPGGTRPKFGMFIHWGLYSVIGQHEWAKEVEGIPLEQYEQLAHAFKPKPNAARDWAKLAKQAGQKYMVMTTKHHEGFCHWDSKLTDY